MSRGRLKRRRSNAVGMVQQWSTAEGDSTRKPENQASPRLLAQIWNPVPSRWPWSPPTHKSMSTGQKSGTWRSNIEPSRSPHTEDDYLKTHKPKDNRDLRRGCGHPRSNVTETEITPQQHEHDTLKCQALVLRNFQKQPVWHPYQSMLLERRRNP